MPLGGLVLVRGLAVLGGLAGIRGIGLDIRKGAVRLGSVAVLGERFAGVSLEYGHGAFERFPGDLHPDPGQSF